MNKSNKDEQNMTVELTIEQIGILKAALQYYWLADDYGYALWGTMPGACLGSSDVLYSLKVSEIYKKLKKITKVKPDYGWWGNIKRIAMLCKNDYKIAKKEGEEAERKMYEDAVLHGSILNEINKHGLNGREILDTAYKVCGEELSKNKNK